MNGLLAYGSLMHPQELDERVAAELPRIPVRVRGFRRSFSQEPSWRSGTGKERGVLTVRQSPGDWCNAVLVRGCAAPVLELLDQRERGYTRHPVSSAHIEPYDDGPPDDDLDDCVIYVGRGEKWNDDLMPNPDYLRICIEAAEQWGPEFLRDFLATTFIRGVPLRDSPPGEHA